MFIKYIISDYRRLYRESGFKGFIKALLNPSFRACFFIRCAQCSPSVLFWVFRSILISFCNIDFGRGCKVGEGLLLPHPIGIVLGGGAVIGGNLTLYQNVTIGMKNNGYPIVGDNVTIYCNSVVVGKVIIGSCSVIGALSFVDKDVTEKEVYKR